MSGMNYVEDKWVGLMEFKVKGHLKQMAKKSVDKDFTTSFSYYLDVWDPKNPM